MDVQLNSISAMVLTWFLVIPILLGSSNSNDPILTHMCSKEIGAKFWREFLDCSVILDSQILTVLNTCIPVSRDAEAERTRCSICSKPDRWVKMMDCMNAHLIELQDETNPNLELSPGSMYRACVGVLIEAAGRSLADGSPFLQEDDRIIVSNCSET